MSAPSAPTGGKADATSAVTVAVVLLLIAAGLGYYAYVLWSQKRTAETSLTSAQAEVVTLRERNAKVGERVVVLEKERVSTSNSLSEAEKEVKALSAKLHIAEQSLQDLQAERAEVKAQLAEFKAFSKQFQRMIDAGQLEVNFRRGRMIVELPAKVLFPSGSAELTDEGKVALREVGKVLRRIRDKRFIVAGHTDSIPVRNELFKNNWELSTGRALMVTQALISAGMRPNQLVAAGYAEYDPVASNGTRRGRKKNRRIEIILEPKLREIDTP